MGESDAPDVLEVLSEAKCQELLASRDLGRLAFLHGDEPEILPVNYAADGSIVVFRTAAGAQLQGAVTRRVAFEVDGWDPDTRVGWSVVVKGVAQDVTRALDQFGAALRSLPVYPLAPGEREQWIAIYPSMISGRRFRRDPSEP